MRGVHLDYDEQQQQLKLEIKPQDIEVKELTDSGVSSLVKKSYGSLFLFEDKISSTVKSAINAAKLHQTETIEAIVAEARETEIRFNFDSDKLIATIEIQAGYGGKTFTAEELTDLAKQQGIKRGLSKKRLLLVAERLATAKPGSSVKEVIAKGLPPRDGKPSKVVPLVPNALDRVLRPQTVSLSRVDMRDLGEIVCVQPGTEILERRPPGEGRAGHDVFGQSLPAAKGEWLPLKPGAGTHVHPDNENILCADIAGMPKFQNDEMWVDDVFISRGVNVGSGNINYDGAVVVNGDVSEKMRIVATGDITINGFVESAIIESGGDIIITQGAMGKHDEDSDTEYSGRLTAKGNIHIQHGQGLDIQCQGNVTIGKQLAYSRIICGGSVTVGPLENPNGNLFACEVQCEGGVRSGTLGAVSGSHLFVDFSSGLNAIVERIESVEDLKNLLRQHIDRHSKKMEKIRKRHIPEELHQRFSELVGRYRDERSLFQELIVTLDKLERSKSHYLGEIGLRATKHLYPGVIVKLNNRTWKAEREYNTANVHYENHQWQYDPM